MKKNRIFKIIINIILVIVISVICELFIFNYKVLFLNNDNKGIKEIKKLNIDEENKTISFNVKGKYVNKLKIKYKAKIDTNVEIEYYDRDYYNTKRQTKNNEKFDNEVKLQVLNIDNILNKVKLSFDDTSNIKIMKIYIDNTLHLNYFRIIFFISVFGLCSFYFLYSKNKIINENLHRYFFLTGLILGLTIIILQPSATFYSWDDQIHFKEVYELGGGVKNWNIGEFEMVDDYAIGRDSISSIEEQENQIKYLNKNDFSGYTSKAGRFINYNKVSYIPLSIGYNLAKLVKLPFNICFKIGKLFNLLVYLSLITLSIKNARIGKRLITVIGLLPSTLFLATQYSYDPAVISGFILATVYIFNWFVDKEFKVDFKNIFVFIIAILFSCFTKAVYIPLIVLMLFIPHNRFNSKKEEYWIKGILMIIFLLVLSTFAMPSDLISEVGGDARGGATSISEQFKLILSNPFGYMRVLWDTSVLQFNDKLFGIQSLGGFAYMGNISDNFYILLIIIISIVSITDTNEFVLKKSQRVLVLIDIIGIVLLIWTALYLSFTPVGLNTIAGVQCRYFIPFIYPIMICFQSKKIQNKLNEKKYNFIILVIMAAIFMITIFKLVLMRYCF